MPPLASSVMESKAAVSLVTGGCDALKDTSDFHCVTRWSRFDNHWEGVAFRKILKLAKPRAEAKFVLVHAEQGFTANVPQPRAASRRTVSHVQLIIAN
jgi:DMSO/TMAO reductase YedYZ molybdopterin-dependent catalytic subunit